MPKPKRITLKMLSDFDFNNHTSLVRQLEMYADKCITSPGYSVQFWQDVQLYGVDEAILYVKNGNHGNADSLAQYWNKLRLELFL